MKYPFIAAVLATSLLVASCSRAPAPPQTATVLPQPNPVPTFSLLDQHGNAIDETVFRGQWDLVFFGFTHCPDICPMTLQVLAAAKAELADSGQSPLPRIVLVSVDPERDTPEVMRQYVDYFGDGNLGITGTLDEITRLTSGLGIYFQKQDTDSEFYNVDHSAAVLVVDPAGGFSAVFGGTHKVENFVHDLPLIMVESDIPQPPLVASDVEITKPMPGRGMSAGYFVLSNNTDQDIRITGAKSPQFGSVQIHETTVEDGVARMRRIDALLVPAKGKVTLERGGKHLMLMQAGDIEDTVLLELLSDGVPVLTISHVYPGETD